MLKIDFEIDLKLSQAKIAKILVDLRLEKSTCMCAFLKIGFFLISQSIFKLEI